jgi:Raf kinase inhibitor-like YbhB/YbcL family protein
MQAKQITAQRLGLGAPSLEVQSPSFNHGRPIARTHAGPRGRSPALRWSKPPEGTREIAIVVEDPDAPSAKPFVHWVARGIAPDKGQLPEGAHPPVEGENDAGGHGWFGPAPPPGHGTHHYHFEVFAVDQPLSDRAPRDRDELIEALRGHVLAWGETVGTYQR